MAERITGINRSTLWLAWKEVRAALRDATIRDVVDFIDYDIEPEVWINRLLRQVSSGAYEPRSPLRFPLSKIPGEMVGLLFFLLERLAIRSTYCDSPGIGLPIDEFECSRTIANLILFPHDRRMVKLVGREAYVRWMDDHVIGVNSEAQGLRVLAAMQDSLASLYLTPNAKKSLVLSLAEAKIHFHLDTNADLDGLESKVATRAARRVALVRELTRAWRLALQNEGKGQWEQIQSRIYRLAGITKARFLRRRAISDLLQNPSLAERISGYMRCSGSAAEYLRFTNSVIAHRHQIHKDVPLLLLESLLRAETRGYTARRILRMAEGVLTDVLQGRRDELFAAPACLLILRFGARRDLSHLRPCFRDRRRTLPSRLIRAAAIVFASGGRKEFSDVRRSAASLLLNPLGLMVRLVLKIMRFTEVPDRYKVRLNARWDPVSNKYYLDMRMLLAARLLALNRKKAVKLWLKSWALKLRKEKMSAFDRRLLARLIR